MQVKRNALGDRLNQLLVKIDGNPASLKTIIDTLAGRGHAALLIIFVLPFCQPIQIPGFSTPFGIILIFIGLRIAFGRHTWIPKFLLNKEISYKTIEKMAKLSIKVTEKLSFLTSTRLSYFVTNPTLHVGHGLAITLLAFFLSLPLPIPFTNLLAAYPILFFGLALLEDDGVMIFVAYFLFYSCIIAFGLLLFFGGEILSSTINQ